MNQKCTIRQNEVIIGPYRKIVFNAPEISSSAQPGQFVHVLITPLRDRVLRRPFSICDADPVNGTLTLVYKIVGRGTDVLASMHPGESCEILGPQGRGYTMPADLKNTFPILVAGGYGSASTFLMAKRLAESGATGFFLTGARTGDDLLLLDEYKKIGFDLLIATDDGSVGHKGFVTDLLPHSLRGARGRTPFIAACGPTPMLNALGKLALTLGVDCE